MTLPRSSNSAVRKFAVQHPVDAAQRIIQLQDALFEAADDLDKAANQFAGLYEGILFQFVEAGTIRGENVWRFADKASKARAVAEDGP